MKVHEIHGTNVFQVLPGTPMFHGVNTRGIMGKGVAAQVRAKAPEVYEEYRKACLAGVLVPGGLFVATTRAGTPVLNCASQKDLGAVAKLEWVESSMTLAAQWCDDNGYSSMRGVAIGCGIGGLKWPDVCNILENISVDVDCYVCFL